MTGEPGVLKRAILAALGYIAIMAVGMFTIGHVFAITYGEPKMVQVLVFFEIALSVYAIFMARRLFGHWHCGFGPVDWRGMVWMLPNFLVMAALFAAVLRNGTVELSGLAVLVVVTTILVGFSEELMFRGVVLRGGLREAGTGRAILISAVLFSLLHSVNMLAFVPFDAMLQQMLLTFVFGLAMACYALRINSLVPVIVFHALWDMVQFLAIIYKADLGQLVMVGIVVNAVVAGALWLTELRNRQVGRLAN